MKNLLRLTSVIFLFSFLLSGCYYDKQEELYPYASNCDTAGTMTYTGNIKSIMAANCNACHPNGNSTGVVTVDYTGLKVIAANGQLWSSVNWTGTRMPKNMDKLSECDLTKIKKWVDHGYPEN
jgi:hypothetical protein